MATLVEYTPKLQRAVDMVIAPLGIKELQAPHRSGRSTFTDRKGAYSEGGGEYEYRGSFKLLIENSKTDPQKAIIRVVEGADFKNNYNTGYKMIVKVNGSYFYTPQTESNEFDTTETSKYYVVVKYTAAGAKNTGDGEDASQASVEIEFHDSKDKTLSDFNDTLDNAYYIIGYVQSHQNGDVDIIQTHLSGAIVFFHSTPCNLEAVDE